MPLAIADAGYGDAAAFRLGLNARGLSYVVGISATLSAQPGDAGPVAPPYLVRERVVGHLAGPAGGFAVTPGVGGGAGDFHCPAQQGDGVVGLIRVDDAVLPAQPPQFLTLGAGQLAGRALARSTRSRRTQLRRLSGLTPSSRATSVTVLPEERTSAMASRLYSSDYRFMYLLPTWRCFLWNLTSQSPGVHDQGEASGGESPLLRSPRPSCARGRPACLCSEYAGRRAGQAVSSILDHEACSVSSLAKVRRSSCGLAPGQACSLPGAGDGVGVESDRAIDGQGLSVDGYTGVHGDRCQGQDPAREGGIGAESG